MKLFKTIHEWCDRNVWPFKTIRALLEELNETNIKLSILKNDTHLLQQFAAKNMIDLREVDGVNRNKSHLKIHVQKPLRLLSTFQQDAPNERNGYMPSESLTGKVYVLEAKLIRFNESLDTLGDLSEDYKEELIEHIRRSIAYGIADIFTEDAMFEIEEQIFER